MHCSWISHIRSRGGGLSRSSYDPSPFEKLISTIKDDVLFKLWLSKSYNWCKIWWKSKISNENQGFLKVWMKCLEIDRLQDLHQIPQGLWGPWAAPKPPTLLFKFLPTGLLVTNTLQYQTLLLHWNCLIQIGFYNGTIMFLYT